MDDLVLERVTRSTQHMSTRRFPKVTAAALVVALALFAASFGTRPLFSTRGAAAEGAWFVYFSGGRVVGSQSHYVSSYISQPAAPSWRNAGGFSAESRRFGPGGTVGGKVMSQHVAVPTYPLPLAFAVLLAWQIGRWRRDQLPGRCPACGYDLRATPDRCPECGAVPQASAEAAA
jgi:hypothetical protein